MQKTTLLLVLLVTIIHWSIPVFSQNETLPMRQFACGLSQPEEAAYDDPVNQTLRLDFTALPAGPVWVKTYNALGVQIIDQQWDALPSQPLNVDISNWPEGRYFMSIQSMDKEKAYQMVKKITVQRK